MSKEYVTVVGDDFISISRSQYGTGLEATRILKANPGVRLPLTAGLVLVIPDFPDAPKNKTQQGIAADHINEVAITIDGSRFRFWSQVQIDRSIDNIDVVEFNAPMNTQSKQFRDNFRPFSYKPVTIFVGGNLLFNGTMIAITPNLTSLSKTISVQCYSLPGVLNDCNATVDSELEFNKLGLRDIAKSLIEPFDFGVDFSVDQGAIFDRVAIESKGKIWSFLTGLAKQRNLVISSTSDGKLLFQKSIEAGNPVASLVQGESPLLSITPNFNTQDYFSHLTGLNTSSIGLKASSYTHKNKRLSGIIRPLSFDLDDTRAADLQKAVESKAGRMFANMVSYSVSLATWRDPQGELWKANTSVKVKAVDAMIYTNYEFIIRSVSFIRERDKELATMELVMPGSFEGKTPEILPWDE